MRIDALPLLLCCTAWIELIPVGTGQAINERYETSFLFCAKIAGRSRRVGDNTSRSMGGGNGVGDQVERLEGGFQRLMIMMMEVLGSRRVVPPRSARLSHDGHDGHDGGRHGK